MLELYGSIMWVHRLPLRKTEILSSPRTSDVKVVEKEGRKKSCSFFCSLWRLSIVWIVTFDWHQVLHIHQLQQNYFTEFITNLWLPGQQAEPESFNNVSVAPPIPVSQEAAGFRHPWGFVGSATFGPLTAHRLHWAQGKALLVQQTHGISPQAGHTVCNILSAAWLHICVISKKKKTLGVFLDDEYYIRLKQFSFKTTKQIQIQILPALLRYWTFIQARTFIGACSDFSSAEHLPSKALLLNQNTQKLQGIFPLQLHCPNPLTPFRDSPLTTITLSIWSTGDHNSARVIYENRYI